MENETGKQEPLLIPEESTETKKKGNLKVELALFLILGVLLGVVIKTEAGKRITMGYEDHKAPLSKQSYSINDIQKELAEKAKKEPANSGSVPSATESLGGVCGN